MYAVENIKKFISDNRTLIGSGEEIIRRAASLAHKGMISGSQAAEVFRDPSLTAAFHAAVQDDPTHMKLWASIAEKEGWKS